MGNAFKLLQSNAVRRRSHQDAVLAFIRKFMGEHDVPPTYREIAGAIGISISAVQRHLDGLIARGEIVRAPGRHKAIALPNDVLRLRLHPDVACGLNDFARRQGISIEAAAAEAIRAYVGAAS